MYMYIYIDLKVDTEINSSHIPTMIKKHFKVWCAFVYLYYKITTLNSFWMDLPYIGALSK